MGLQFDGGVDVRVSLILHALAQLGDAAANTIRRSPTTPVP